MRETFRSIARRTNAYVLKVSVVNRRDAEETTVTTSDPRLPLPDYVMNVKILSSYMYV